MNEEAITNMLNVVRHLEQCRVKAKQEAMAATRGESDGSPLYIWGRHDGFLQSKMVVRNMLRSMGVAIPEDV
jgi:hypothetical protein